MSLKGTSRMKYPTQKEKKFSLVCQFCKGEFKGATSKTLTCSKKCSMALYRSKQIRTKFTLACQECGGAFTSYLDRTKHCSQKCRDKYYYKIAPKKATSLKICRCCGSDFNSDRTYCSRECYRIRTPDPERKSVSNVLSLRWELLARVSPPEFKELMYKIERRLPIHEGL